MRGLIAAGLLALVSCSAEPALTGDAKAVHEICIANGGDKAYCDCTTKELQAKLTPEVFAQVARHEPGADPAATLDAMAAADASCKKPS